MKVILNISNDNFVAPLDDVRIKLITSCFDEDEEKIKKLYDKGCIYRETTISDNQSIVTISFRFDFVSCFQESFCITIVNRYQKYWENTNRYQKYWENTISQSWINEAYRTSLLEILEDEEFQAWDLKNQMMAELEQQQSDILDDALIMVERENKRRM